MDPLTNFASTDGKGFDMDPPQQGGFFSIVRDFKRRPEGASASSFSVLFADGAAEPSWHLFIDGPFEGQIGRFPFFDEWRIPIIPKDVAGELADLPPTDAMSAFVRAAELPCHRYFLAGVAIVRSAIVWRIIGPVTGRITTASENLGDGVFGIYSIRQKPSDQALEPRYLAERLAPLFSDAIPAMLKRLNIPLSRLTEVLRGTINVPMQILPAREVDIEGTES